MAKRYEIGPNCQPFLFGTDERIAPDSKTQPVVRLFDHSRILIGTSAFTAAGWSGSFHPVGVFVNSGTIQVYTYTNNHYPGNGPETIIFFRGYG
jgi:hypothetical protein